jgi:hypothetical protein
MCYEGSRREAGIFEGGIQLFDLGFRRHGSRLSGASKRFRGLSLSPPLFSWYRADVSRLGWWRCWPDSCSVWRISASALLQVGRNLRGRRASFFHGVSRCTGRFSAACRSLRGPPRPHVSGLGPVLQNMLESPFGIGIGTAGGKVQRESQILIPRVRF